MLQHLGALYRILDTETGGEGMVLMGVGEGGESSGGDGNGMGMD